MESGDALIVLSVLPVTGTATYPLPTVAATNATDVTGEGSAGGSSKSGTCGIPVVTLGTEDDGIIESDNQVTLMQAIHLEGRDPVPNENNNKIAMASLSNGLSVDPTSLSVDPTGPKVVSNVTIEGDDQGNEMTDAKYIKVIKRRSKREKCASFNDEKGKIRDKMLTNK